MEALEPRVFISTSDPEKMAVQQRSKLKVGTLMLVKEDGVPSISWCMGRVLRVQAGDDSTIRVATVLVRGKEVSRTFM